MILKNALDLSNSIGECRRNIYELTKNKGISDPDVAKVSQKLDGKITMLQKYIYMKFAPCQKEHLLFRITNMVKPASILYDCLLKWSTSNFNTDSKHRTAISC